MDDFEDYNASTVYNASRDVQMDFNLAAESTYCNTLTGSITFNHTPPPIGFNSTENVHVQNLQPQKISRSQWDGARDFIHEQYIVKNRTLNELVSYMEKQHSFVASKQQFVRKLKEWKFEKNRQIQDWSAISRALKRKRLEVNEADVYLNGSLIPSKKLKKEISRWDRPSLQTKYLVHLDPQFEASLRKPDGFIITRHNTYSIPVSPPGFLPWFDFVDYLTTLSSDLRPKIYESAHQRSLTPYISSDRHDSMMSIFRADQTSSSICPQKGTDQLAVHLVTRLSPMLVERTPGDLEQAITEMSTTQSPLKLYMLLLAYIVYLCTNYLAEEFTLLAFFSMFKNHELGEAFLGQLLVTKNPTCQIFTTILFHHSVSDADFWLLERVAPKMTNIDIKLHSDHGRPCSALHMAIEDGNLSVARFLLSHGSDPNQCISREHFDCCQEQNCLRPMDLAAKSLYMIDLVHDLLDLGANFNRKRILISAIRRSTDAYLIQRLRRAGALIQASIELDYIEHPLMSAIWSGRIVIFEQLIHDHLFAPIAQDAFDRNTATIPDRVGPEEELPGFIVPLICAIIYGNRSMVNSLIAMGADVNECFCQCLGDVWKSLVEAGSGEDFMGPLMGCEWDLGFRLEREIYSPLQAAAFAGDEDMIRKLVNLGACVESCHGTSALTRSVWAGNRSMTELLLELGADPNAFGTGVFPLTPLMIAVAKDDAAMVVLLLSYGADVDLETVSTHYTQNVLVRLYVSQCDERVRRLARMNKRNKAAAYNGTYLQISSLRVLDLADPSSNALADSSASCCSVPPQVFEEVLNIPHGINLLKICLEGGSDPCRLIGARQWSPLVLALDNVCCHCSDNDDGLLKCVSLLLRYGSKIGLTEFSKLLATRTYKWRGIMEQVLLFPECLTDLLQCYTDEIREAVRLHSVKRLYQIVLAVLRAMKRQISTFELSQTLCHVLYASSFVGYRIEEFARVLFEEGSHINSMINLTDLTPWLIIDHFVSAESAYMSPLHLLLGWKGPDDKHEDICCMRLRVLQLLVDAGAGVNVPSTDLEGTEGWTPLQLACVSGGCFDEVKYLVEAGANVNAPASSMWLLGQTALQAAAEQGNLKIVEYLIAKGAHVNAPAGANSGATALQYAAGCGCFRIVQVLVESGATIDAPGAEIEGRTAIEMAAENGRIDCLYYLLDRWQGRTPISEVCERAAEYARREGHHVIADFLSSYPSGRATE